MNQNLVNDMKMWKGTGNTTTLLFDLKGLEIVHQERRGQVKTIVMEYLNGILFHKSRPVNKQHTNQPPQSPSIISFEVYSEKKSPHSPF